MDLELSHWLSPWEFSPTLVLLFLISGVLFVRGTWVHKVARARQWYFWTGFVLLYLSMHTHVDYYAERVFFAHRAQHLVLHHLGPLLIMLSYPGQVLRAGMPLSWRIALKNFRQTRTCQTIEAVLTNKFLIPFMFVFLVLVWLEPTVQFYSMLDWRLYRVMNWSVVISGFLYWNLVIDRRPYVARPMTATTAFGRWWQIHGRGGKLAAMTPTERVISPILTMAPQIVAGIYIAFVPYDLYPLFDVCGRAVPITALEDQSIGGIIMWVPAAIVESFGIVVALATWVRLSAAGRMQKPAWLSNLQLNKT